MRGKTRGRAGDGPHLALASMRPPQNAGENGRHNGGTRQNAGRFNEAPAECGGKPVDVNVPKPPRLRLQ